MSIPTQRDLQASLNYDPNTGIFIWKNPQARCMSAGDYAGYIGAGGYLYIRLNITKHLAHRLAWLYIHGLYPQRPVQIDHINRIRTDNRISNLRLVTAGENQKNRNPNKNNKSGVAGVVWNRKALKWQVQISVERKCIYLGIYSDFNYAVKVRKTAELKYGFTPK